MRFPDAARAFAEDRASALDAEDPVEALYDEVASLSYGVSQGFAEGRWARYPHELDGEANCYENAVYTYLLADEMGLDPRFFKIGERGGHGIVDVGVGGERVVVDPNLNLRGPVDWYDDTGMRLVENKDSGRCRRDFDWITEQSVAEIVDELENLRENPVGMLREGQRLGKVEAPDGSTVKDRVQFHEDTRTLERRLKCYGRDWPYNHLVRVEWPFDERGTVREPVTHFEAVRGSNRRRTWGDVRLATDAGEGLEVHTDVPDVVREQVARYTAYREAADDDLCYGSEELERFWERTFKDELATWADAEPGRGVWTRMQSRLSGAEGVVLDFQELDYLRYVWEHDVQLPDDAAYEEMLPTYLTRHRELLSRARDADHQEALEPLLDGVGAYLSDRSEAGRSGSSPGGIATVYDRVADQAVTDEELLAGVLAVSPESRDAYREEAAVPEMVERFEGWTPIDTPLAGTLERTWSFDPVQYELHHTVKVDDGDRSAYDGFVRISYGFTVNGERTNTRIRLTEEVEQLDEGWCLASYGETTDAPEARMELSLADLREVARQRVDRFTDPGVLDAPEPAREASFLERNRHAALLYGMVPRGEEYSILDEDGIDAQEERMRRWNEVCRDAPVGTVRQEDRSEGTLEQLDMLRDDPETRQAILQSKYVEWMQTEDRTDDLDTLVEETMPGAEAQVASYVNKYVDAFEEWLETDAFREARRSMLDMVSRGLAATVPAAETVHQQAEENLPPAGKRLYEATDALDVSAAKEAADQLTRTGGDGDDVRTAAADTLRWADHVFREDGCEETADELAEQRETLLTGSAAEDLGTHDRVDTLQEALTDALVDSET